MKHLKLINKLFLALEDELLKAVLEETEISEYSLATLREVAKEFDKKSEVLEILGYGE